MADEAAIIAALTEGMSDAYGEPEATYLEFATAIAPGIALGGEGGEGGDVFGPSSSVDNGVVVFNGITGKTIKGANAPVNFGGQDITNVGAIAGHVPTTRQIINGTGITGGGNLSSNLTLSVVQSALDPVNMGSGAAADGQVPKADGLGGIAWEDEAGGGGVTGPGSSTDHALARWDSTAGAALLNSVVTVSDTGAMVFPSGGSISKPGTGTNSEAFGASAVADADSSLAVGYQATVNTAISGDTTGAIAIGATARVGNAAQPGSDAAMAIGYGAIIGHTASYSMALGYSAVVGYECIYSIAIGPNASISAPRAVAIGQNSVINTSADAAIAIGDSTAVTANSDYAVAIGYQSYAQGVRALALGYSSRVLDSYGMAIGDAYVYGQYGIGIGDGATLNSGTTSSVGIGRNVSISANSIECVAIGYGATIGDGVDRAIAIGEAAIASGGSNCVALGRDAFADASDAIAVGYDSEALSTYSISIGRQASNKTGTSTSIAIGYAATNWTNVNNAICIGRYSECANSPNGDFAIAIGDDTAGKHTNAIAIGRGAETTATSRCTIGTIGGLYDQELQFGRGLGCWGVAPPGSQPAKINDPTDLASCITAIASIINVLEGAGLSST